MLINTGCGSKRSPSGGPIDEISPKILSISPAQFQQIDNNEIIVNFSKLMDQSSINAGLSIYPPILNKKLSWKRNVLHIKINEKLKENTNYLISFNNNLKCYHGNPLDKPETFIFNTGKLNDHTIRGKFSFEKDEDKNLIKTILLLDKDSLLVLERQFDENNFVIDYLNYEDMIIRSFIDKNNNKRYDYGNEPYFQSFVPNNYNEAIKIELTYQDTVKPDIKQVKAISKNDIQITFNKELSTLPFTAFVNNEKSSSLSINTTYMENNTIHYITNDQDTIKYEVIVQNIFDKKNNYNEKISTFVIGSDKLLKTNPKVLNSSIRNGSAIDDLSPILKIEFSEIMLKGNLFYSLKEVETNNFIPLNILKSNSKIWHLQPKINLKPFNSYIFIIEKESKNHQDLTLEEDFIIQFMVKDKKK